ncbi:dihydroorotate dehydrogenase [Thermoplasmatales archaeon AK]|nr:dihydroorotate dehydrogenase [Thermoplasmatales archaeon AK]
MPDLSVRLASGIILESPLILASGILDENGYSIKRILQEGAAAAVTKSIGIQERAGYKPPVVVDLGDTGILNAVGLSNPGIDDYHNEMKIALQAGKPIIGSIFGATVDEFLQLAVKMESYGASAVELNLSCPHVKGVGTEVGSDFPLVEEIIASLKRRLSIPVYAKLSPNLTDVVEAARACSKADGVVLINTIRAMSIDIHAKKPVLSNYYGGLSGPAIRPVGVRLVYQVKRETGMEIIGVGGIENGGDAIEYMMAGASAVQIGTAVRKYGRSVFMKIKDEIHSFMEREGYSRIEDIVGAALP